MSPVRVILLYHRSGKKASVSRKGSPSRSADRIRPIVSLVFFSRIMYDKDIAVKERARGAVPPPGRAEKDRMK